MSAPVCNRCRRPMWPAAGLVPILRCVCGREIPDERNVHGADR